MFHVSLYGRCLALLCGVAIRYALPVMWVMSCLSVIGHAMRMTYPEGTKGSKYHPSNTRQNFLECFQNLRTRVTHAAVHNTHVAIAFNEFDYNVFASFSSTRAYVRACPRRHAHVCAACSVNSPLAKNWTCGLARTHNSPTLVSHAAAINKPRWMASLAYATLNRELVLHHIIILPL